MTDVMSQAVKANLISHVAFSSSPLAHSAPARTAGRVEGSKGTKLKACEPGSPAMSDDLVRCTDLDQAGRDERSGKEVER